jgi:hypothetical protein
MTQLPLQPRLDSYGGSKVSLVRKAMAHNAMAKNVVEHINRLIAQNVERHQQYFWPTIARNLDLTEDEVRSAVMYGGGGGVTLEVTEEYRIAMSSYK